MEGWWDGGMANRGRKMLSVGTRSLDDKLLVGTSYIGILISALFRPVIISCSLGSTKNESAIAPAETTFDWPNTVT